MQIKFVRKVRAEELVEEFKAKYGSFNDLERYIKNNPDDYSALVDFEDWKNFLENPELEIEEGEIVVTGVSFLTPSKLHLLEAIKKFQPGSIRELAEKVGRDLKNVYNDLKELEKAGLIDFKEKGRAKKANLRYNEILITI